ncbi:MAG TPA: bifunctional nuclease domain-containing protein [Candidatus Binataceae bacterium]|nr:bifunctional nuclease domain-containing protein [Candidatus Binataceae bacterium]
MIPPARAIKSIFVAAAAAILGSFALLACFGGHNAGRNTREIRVKVSEVGFDQRSNTHYVTLEDQDGRRAMPIMIGDDEARTIMLELNGVKPDRPLTTDLLRNVILQTGNHLDRVVIGDMRNQVFYAQIYLDHDRYVVDSRPSDAIALAMGAQVPIYITGEIFDASAETVDSAPPQFAIVDGITVQDLTPSIASYFGVPPSSGVLVADLAPPAAHTLKRGDIITQLDDRPVPSPAVFKTQGDQINGTPLKLGLLRDGQSVTVVFKPANAH